MMDKMHFVLYLNPPRPDFAHTMSDEELSIMKQHVAYWKEYVDNGVMLVLGPVMDPAGVYGLGIVEVDSEDQLQSLMKNDPATAINKYEYYAMRAVTAKILKTG
ncbi:MAG: YciI family protein [Bacteroidota bacterium]|nr:YciI family protein [Bacteroidota bacterium]